MIKLFLKLRGTPVVIVTDEFQGWEGIKETFFAFFSSQPSMKFLEFLLVAPLVKSDGLYI